MSEVAHPQSAPIAPDEGARQSLWQRLLGLVFGYDFFISYAWSDGGSYAMALARKLQAQGFEIFLDREEYASGDDWKKVGAWKLRRTGQLILVGSPATLTSAPVLREVQIFSRTGRRIVPIDFDGSLQWTTTASPLAELLPLEILRIREPVAALTSGPSEQVVNTLRRTFNLVRQDKKRVRVVGIIAVVLGILAVAAGAGAVIAVQQRDEATHQALISAHEAYAADLELSEVYRGTGNPDRAVEILRKYRPRGASPGMREFTWRYLWNLYDSHRHAVVVIGEATGLDLSPDGRILAIGSNSPLVTLWDTITGREIGRIVSAGEKVKSAVLVAGGSRVAIATEDHLRLWERERPEKPVVALESIMRGALSTDRSVVIANEDDEQLQVIDAHTGIVTTARPAEELGVIEQQATSPDSNTIAVATNRSRVFVLDARTRRITYAGNLPRRADFNGIALTTDGALLIAGKSDDHFEIEVRDLSTDSVRRRLRGPKTADGSLVAMAASDDGGKIALLVGDSTILHPEQHSRLVVFDARSGKELYTLDQSATGFVTAMAFVPTADVLVTGNRRHELMLWHAASGLPKALLGVHHNTPTRDGEERNEHRPEGMLVGKSNRLNAGLSKILVSSDGKTLVSYDGELGSVRIWNTEVESRVHPLAVKANDELSVAFSPDGSVAVTGGGAGEVAAWRGQDGAPLARAAGHAAGVSRIVFSQTGASFASASEDGVVKVWRTADLIENASFKGGIGAVQALVLGERRLIQLAMPRRNWTAEAGLPAVLTSWPLAGGGEPLVRTFPPGVAVLSPRGDRLALMQEEESPRACHWTIVEVESGVSRNVPIEQESCFAFAVQAAAWSSDGKLLAFGGPARHRPDGSEVPSGIRILDAESGRERPPLPLPMHQTDYDVLAGLQFSSNGRTLVVLSAIRGRDRSAFVPLDQPVVTVWDVESGKTKATLPVTSSALCGKGQGVKCLRFVGLSADETAVALIDSERTDGGLGKSEAVVLPLDGGAAEVFASPRVTAGMAIAPAGERVATVNRARDWGSPILLWDRKSRALLASLGYYTMWIDAVVRSPEGRFVVQTFERPVPNGVLSRVWDLETGQMLASSRDLNHRATEVSPNGDLLAEIDEPGVVTIRDARTHNVVRSIDTKLTAAERPDWRLDPLPLLHFADQGRTLATVGKTETTLWDVKTGARLYTLAGLPPVQMASTSGAYAAMVGCRKWTIYDTRTGRAVAARPYDQCPNGAAVSADGRLLLTLVSTNAFSEVLLGGRTEARLWRLGSDVSTLLTGYDNAKGIGAFAPDGATIATDGPDGAVNLWDPVTGRKLLTLPGFKQKVTGLRFSNDGRTLMVAYEREVRTWSAAPDNRSSRDSPAR